MYFWKTDKLVNDFSNENVTQYEQFKYMLLYSLLTVLALDRYLVPDSPYTAYDFINTISFLFITFWGVRLCYKSNQQNDDNDFIARFICLGLPVIVRIFVIFVPTYFVIGTFGHSFFNYGISYDASGNEFYTVSLIEVTFTIVFGVAFYQYLSKKIGLININNKAQQ